MGWREVLTPEPSDKRDKSPQNDHFKGNSSQNDPFSHYCHHDSGIENDESKDKRSCDTPKTHTDSIEIIDVPDKPLEGEIAFVSLLTDTEREYYLDLVAIMQSPKFGMDRETAEKEAGAIVARNRHPLQIKQATQVYRRYGYIKIFSTVLNRAVYLAKHEQAAKRVPDRDIPAYTESDIEAVKGLDPEVAKVLLEARILFGGPIKEL